MTKYTARLAKGTSMHDVEFTKITVRAHTLAAAAVNAEVHARRLGCQVVGVEVAALTFEAAE